MIPKDIQAEALRQVDLHRYTTPKRICARLGITYVTLWRWMKLREKSLQETVSHGRL